MARARSRRGFNSTQPVAIRAPVFSSQRISTDWGVAICAASAALRGRRGAAGHFVEDTAGQPLLPASPAGAGLAGAGQGQGRHRRLIGHKGRLQAPAAHEPGLPETLGGSRPGAQGLVGPVLSGPPGQDRRDMHRRTAETCTAPKGDRVPPGREDRTRGNAGRRAMSRRRVDHGSI